MGSKDQLFLLKLESSDDQDERAELINHYLQSFNNNSGNKTAKLVPDFPKDSEWMNCKEPLSLKSNLRGKICVLDFFTYCCINCMHILPDLHALEREFSIESGLVVVGVHSAKFENEKVSANILNAVLRYGITHPVVNDSQAHMWNKMEITCWPTLVIVGPNGQNLLSLVGEGHKNTVMEFVSLALKWFTSLGQISDHSIELCLEKDILPRTSLSFPGKLSMKGSGDKMAVSDTGHHRILIVDPRGIVETTVGGGISMESGFVDGNFQEARFNCPQGVVWKGESTLFVADTENHAIRMVDFKSGRVTTVAGTGQQGNDKVGGKHGEKQPISSPWDVTVGPAPGSLNIMEDESVLYIAMAGTHQIWGLCLSDTRWIKGNEQPAWTCLRFSGSGAEENRNNSYPHKTGYAQPSGLSVARDKPLQCIFVADSESSSIRTVSITSGGSKALVGAERDPMNLFAFGDVDGSGVEAKLQHPLAVAWNSHTQQLFVADSYNHKIKVVDAVRKSCKTILGTGEPGCCNDDGAVQFNEPGGLDTSADGKTLYVADTNNNAVRVVDLTDNSVSTLAIVGNNLPETSGPLLDSTDSTDSTNGSSGSSSPVKYSKLVPRNAAVVDCDAVVISGDTMELQLTFTLPKNCKLTEGVTSKWQLVWLDDGNEHNEGHVIETGIVSSITKPISIQARLPNQTTTKIQMEAKIYYCEPDGACFMKGVLFKIPITRSAEKNVKNYIVKLHHHFKQ